jgi:hypothetical protein
MVSYSHFVVKHPTAMLAAVEHSLLGREDRVQKNQIQKKMRKMD